MRTAAAPIVFAGLILFPSALSAGSGGPLDPGPTASTLRASASPPEPSRGRKGPDMDAGVSGLLLQVRTYDQAALAPTVRVGMRQAAASVLATAGIQLAWLSCDADREAAPCPAPLGRDELALRLVREAIRATAGPITLGYSLVNPSDRSGALATVYVDRVSRLADLGALDLPTILGRAVAHEIGHLLLGSTRHSEVGVMRAAWSPQDLLRDRPGDWAFTVDEADRLQDALMQRTLTR